MVETVRRKEQPNGCGTMPRRSEFGERRFVPDSFSVVVQRAEKQAYDPYCIGVLYVIKKSLE